jgi:hypothetical protein
MVVMRRPCLARLVLEVLAPIFVLVQAWFKTQRTYR